MGSRLFSPSSFLYLLCFVQVVHVKIQPSLADPDDYTSCSFQFQCGKITAGFPFWGGDRPVACGHRNLQLNCEYNVATMTIGDVKYVVLNVDERAQVLKIARQDYQDGICPPKLINTTFDSAIIDLSAGYAMLSLSYGCPLKLNTGQETCDNNDISCLNGLIYSGEPGECNNKVNIPVAETLRSEVECNISALEIAVQEGFEVKWKLSSIACGSCTISNGSCGYDDVSNQTICYCPDGKLNISTTCSASTSRGSSFNNKRNIFIGIAAGVVGIIVTLVILLIVGLRRYRNKTTDNDKKVEAFIRNYESLAPRRYKYSDVKTMTKSFSHKLGQGGYGDVYKGKLPNDRLVAVKVIKGSRGNGEEFINEVASITRTSHVNIVTLVGFCYEKKKRVLIYEFMPNGSLDKFIYDKESSSTTRKLEWRTMYQIAVGIARGLEYLHRGCNIRIVHFDIKPHNILLDEDFCPKISDFGLAKQSEKKESTILLRDERGTRGYTAPEVSDRSLGGVSHKSDVYSYGMMILEIVGGRKNLDPEVSNLSEIYFPNSVYKHIEPGNDFQLHGVINEEEKEIAKKMITVSFWCIQKNPSDRPSMTKVVEMLEGSIESLPIPPKPSLS